MMGWIIAGAIIACAIGLKAYLERNNAPVTPATPTAPAGTGAAVAPPVPPPPTGWEAFKTKVTGFWTEYWKDSVWIPVTVFTVIIHLFIWELYPTWIWEPMKKNVGFVILLYIAYIIGITALKANKVWKARTANWTMLMCIVMLTTNVFEVTPWFGEEWHIARLTMKAEKENARQELAKELAIASFLPEDPNGEVVIAPVGRKSQRIETRSGPRLDAKGKIFVFLEDNPPPVRMGPDVNDAFSQPADWVRVMSRSGKEEKVVVTLR